MFDKEIEMTEIQQKLRDKFSDNVWIEACPCIAVIVCELF